MTSDRQLIFMLRHGEPDFPDRKSYIYGHTDYPLAKDGVRQAKKIGKALSKIKMHRIISSDLARASQTADIVAAMQSGAPGEVMRDASLREINMGEWDGVPKDDIERNYGKLFAARAVDFANIAAPGGESFTDLQKRGVEAFYSILGASEGASNLLLVAHGGIFWAIVCDLFNLSLCDIFRFGLDYCALHLIEYKKKSPAPDSGNFRLIRYNWSPDLENFMNDLI